LLLLLVLLLLLLLLLLVQSRWHSLLVQMHPKHGR
jgi:hypothetical protein